MGKRLKRYLLLRSLKGKLPYMLGSEFPPPVGAGEGWVAQAHYIIESSQEKENGNLAQEKENQLPVFSKETDETVSGLIEEFLQEVNPTADSELTRPTVEYFISEFNIIFDVKAKDRIKANEHQLY